MEYVVRFETDEDGFEEYRNDLWHYVFSSSGARSAFCSGQVFGYGESAVEYEVKIGQITCPTCCEMISSIKAISKTVLKPKP